MVTSRWGSPRRRGPVLTGRARSATDHPRHQLAGVARDADTGTPGCRRTGCAGAAQDPAVDTAPRPEPRTRPSCGAASAGSAAIRSRMAAAAGLDPPAEVRRGRGVGHARSAQELALLGVVFLAVMRPRSRSEASRARAWPSRPPPECLGRARRCGSPPERARMRRPAPQMTCRAPAPSSIPSPITAARATWAQRTQAWRLLALVGGAAGQPLEDSFWFSIAILKSTGSASREILDSAQLVGGGQDVQVPEAEVSGRQVLGQVGVVEPSPAGVGHPLVRIPSAE